MNTFNLHRSFLLSRCHLQADSKSIFVFPMPSEVSVGLEGRYSILIFPLFRSNIGSNGSGCIPSLHLPHLYMETLLQRCSSLSFSSFYSSFQMLPSHSYVFFLSACSFLQWEPFLFSYSRCAKRSMKRKILSSLHYFILIPSL